MLTYVINLETRKDRLEYIENKLSLQKEVDLDVNIFKAINGKKLLQTDSKIEKILTLGTLETLRYPDRVHSHHQILTPGAIGCSLSHITIAEQFLKTKEEACLVLEDDIDILQPLSQAIEEWQNVKGTVDLYHINKGIKLDKLNPYGTHGYIMNRKAASTIVKYAYPLESQIDSYFNKLKELDKMSVQWSKIDYVVQRSESQTDIQDYKSILDVFRTMKKNFSSFKINVLIFIGISLLLMVIVSCYYIKGFILPIFGIVALVIYTYTPLFL